MTKITAHYSEKMPAMREYSSRQVGASVEVEIDTDDAETIKGALRRLYSLVKAEVAAQQTAQKAAPARQPATGIASSGNGNGYRPASRPANGNGRFVPATASQKKAVYAICKAKGQDFQQYDLESMSLKETSRLIDQLKNG